jgi:hypothetical protein
MTATPRVYKPAAKIDAVEADVVVASMDDPKVFGPELYRLGFGEAVTHGLLADYRVLILTVAEDAISESFQNLLSSDGDLNLPDIAKIVGCLAGLSKRQSRTNGIATEEPMRRAVAFWSTIAESKRFAEQFDAVAEHYQSTDNQGTPSVGGAALAVPTRHVDGTTNIRRRAGGWGRRSDGVVVGRRVGGQTDQDEQGKDAGRDEVTLLAVPRPARCVLRGFWRRRWNGVVRHSCVPFVWRGRRRPRSVGSRKVYAVSVAKGRRRSIHLHTSQVFWRFER